MRIYWGRMVWSYVLHHSYCIDVVTELIGEVFVAVPSDAKPAATQHFLRSKQPVGRPLTLQRLIQGRADAESKAFTKERGADF